jgi:hypothetical protein
MFIKILLNIYVADYRYITWDNITFLVRENSKSEEKIQSKHKFTLHDHLVKHKTYISSHNGAFVYD